MRSNQNIKQLVHLLFLVCSVRQELQVTQLPLSKYKQHLCGSGFVQQGCPMVWPLLTPQSTAQGPVCHCSPPAQHFSFVTAVRDPSQSLVLLIHPPVNPEQTFLVAGRSLLSAAEREAKNPLLMITNERGCAQTL